jgi:hypothetical protein
MSEWLSPEQAAEELPQFKAEWFRTQLRTGRLAGSKIGGRWFTTKAALDAMVEAGSNSTARRRRQRVAS